MAESEQKRSILETRLRLLTFGVAVRTDEPEVAAFCRQLYGRFLDPSRTSTCTLEVQSVAPGRWRVRDAYVDAVVQEKTWLNGIVSGRLLETAGNEVEDYDLFHGAALSHDGRGLILCGESGYGKSVLTLSLLKRGWSFLTDEVASLDGQAFRLVPFPKAIEMRPEAARLVGLAADGKLWRRGKLAHDAESLFPGCLSAPCPLSAVVFLEPNEDRGPRPVRDTMELTVHRRDERLCDIVQRLEGVREVCWQGEQDGFPVLRIRHEPRGFAAGRLDEVLGRNGVLTMSSSAEDNSPVDFSREPRLEPLESHAGVGRLLVNFRGRQALAKKIDRLGGDFGGVFLSLLQRLKPANFYNLRVGRLERMLSLLEQAVD